MKGVSWLSQETGGCSGLMTIVQCKHWTATLTHRRSADHVFFLLKSHFTTIHVIKQQGQHTKLHFYINGQCLETHQSCDNLRSSLAVTPRPDSESDADIAKSGRRLQ